MDDRNGRRKQRSRSRSPRSRSPLRGSMERGRGFSRDRREIEKSNDRMVYISNIPYDVRWMELKDLVREKAGEVAFVEMLETHPGRAKGCAVVEFKDYLSAKKCVEEMNKLPLRDRFIVVKEIRDPIAFFRKVKEDVGVDFLANRNGQSSWARGGGGGRGTGDAGGGNMRRSGDSGSGEQYETYGLSPNFLRQLGIEGPLCSRVFVANLPYNVQSGRIIDIFNLSGKVTWCDLQMDKEGKSKGLAVVEFSHPIEAVQAISMLNNARVHDRTINVKMDKFEKRESDQTRPGELPSGLRDVGMGLGAGGAPLTNIAAVIGQQSQPQQAIVQSVQAQQQPMPQIIQSQPMMNNMVMDGGNFGNNNNQPQQQNQMMNTSMNTNFGGNTNTGFVQPQMNQNLQTMQGNNNMNGLQNNGGNNNMMGGVMNQQASGMYGGNNMNSGNQVGVGNSQMGGNMMGAAMGGGNNMNAMGQQQQQQQQQQAIQGGGYGASSGGFSNQNNAGHSQSGNNGPFSSSQMDGGGNNGRGPFGRNNSGDGRDGGGSYGRMSPINRSDSLSHHLSGPDDDRKPTRTIILRSLPMDYTWQMVRERLRGFGEIEHADMISVGTSKVRFSSPMEAQRAYTKLNGMSVEGRAITVEYV